MRLLTRAQTSAAKLVVRPMVLVVPAPGRGRLGVLVPLVAWCAVCSGAGAKYFSRFSRY